MSTENPKKKVWIACRATPECEGTYAEIVFERSQGQDGRALGSFLPVAGGKIVRYRCLTCGRSFHVSF